MPADTTLMMEGVPIVSTIFSSDMTGKIPHNCSKHQIIFVFAFIMSADPFPFSLSHNLLFSFLIPDLNNVSLDPWEVEQTVMG